MFDYFAAGQPILCDFPCRYNPAINYGAGMEVRDARPQEIATVIGQLAKLPAEQRRLMGAKARRAAEDYAFKCPTDKLMAVIESIPEQ